MISADEKTSIQGAGASAPDIGSGPPGERCAMSMNISAAGPCNTWPPGMSGGGLPLGRCEAKTGIEPFHRLIELVMSRDPYRSARRVCWIIDGGSSHRGEAFARRLQSWYRNAIMRK